MGETPQLLLIGAVAAVGVLHTVVPDHWVPITLLARQHGWSRRETARNAFVAGTGHVVSTLIIAADRLARRRRVRTAVRRACRYCREPRADRVRPVDRHRRMARGARRGPARSS